ncbi:MAG: hypothetical protein KME42_17270 [Tildeniella nuda ZEHNDER 1965/U140]|jgi:hypothetical protein|nr:hypothetical protein [Tildeniella nuda ZEHNDER 1965/U140]
MKIVKHTPNYLQLKSIGTGWIWLFLLVGMLCLLIGLSWLRSGGLQPINLVYAAAMLVTGSVTTLVALFSVAWLTVYTFDQRRGVVVLQQQYVLRSQTIERRLQDIAAVQVDEQEDSDRSRFYVVNLVLHSGETLCLRETVDNPDRQKYEQIADSIRQFLESTE